MFINPAVAMTSHTAGKVKVLGCAGLNRLSTMPDVPTFREQGFVNDHARAIYRGESARSGAMGQAHEETRHPSELISRNSCQNQTLPVRSNRDCYS
jgi:hypothetical protein